MTDADLSDDKAWRELNRSCAFVLAASQPDHLDSLPLPLPEVAIWGRSNVGKSSLINALVDRKSLARASNTPGRTQQIVFFNLGDQLYLADLPGYGHAKAPREDIKKWNAFIRAYLRKSSRLRCVLLLIDARHGIKEIDEEKMAFLDEMAVSYQVVLTKTDQVRGGVSDALRETIAKHLVKHPAARPTLIETSAEKKTGLEALRALLVQSSL